jgi:hypothetical protein
MRLLHRPSRPILLRVSDAHAVLLLVLFALGLAVASAAEAAEADDDMAIALNLAEMLRASRAIISAEQSRIDDPELGDKGLTGQVVLDRAVARFRQATGIDPAALDPASRQGRLLHEMTASIAEVVDANQATINAKGTGFKAFIPSTFGRLVVEAFARDAKGEAQVKVTAPPELIRNRRARPDAWEAEIIRTKLLAPGWPRGQAFSDTVRIGERDAFRVMVPEYYAASCLSCHGEPKGEMDKTGYPKEGSKVDDLGGVISITLYH